MKGNASIDVPQRLIAVRCPSHVPVTGTGDAIQLTSKCRAHSTDYLVLFAGAFYACAEVWAQGCRWRTSAFPQTILAGSRNGGASLSRRPVPAGHRARCGVKKASIPPAIHTVPRPG